MKVSTKDHFDAGHALPEIEKCKVPHGHTYSVEVSVIGEPDEKGMVIDFGILKKALKEVLNYYDHHFILCEKYIKLKDDVPKEQLGDIVIANWGVYSIILPEKDLVALKGEATAENIASEIKQDLIQTLGVMGHSLLDEELIVKVWEGLNNNAEI